MLLSFRLQVAGHMTTPSLKMGFSLLQFLTEHGLSKSCTVPTDHVAFGYDVNVP